MYKLLVLTLLVIAVQSKPWTKGVRDRNCPKVDAEYPVFGVHIDCNRYFECSGGLRYEMTCPEGLHWNRLLSICDVPRDAGCKSEESQQLPQWNQFEADKVKEEVVQKIENDE